jgi:betaine-aldehyde dehydrogenase
MTTDLFVRTQWQVLAIPGPDREFTVATGEFFEDRDPTTQELVAEVRSSTIEDVARAVTLARLAFKNAKWRNDGATRARILFRYGERLREHVGALAELLTREQGKSLSEARSEIMGSADMVDYYAGLARAVEGRALALGDDAHGVVIREPLGVVAVITPWNWPLTLLMRSLAPALAAGNACVVKPASLTPAITVEALALLALEPELPDGILTCVLGPGGVIGDALVGHSGVDMIAFTGESGTGISVGHRAASDLRKVALELGGKSANLVFADANLDKALDGAMNAIFTTTGQICTAGSRLLVESSVYHEFVDRIVKRANELTLGDPLDPATTLAPLVSMNQQHVVQGYVELGAKEGTVLTNNVVPSGGLFETGCFAAPAIIADLALDSRVFQEEIFGPVLTVHEFADEQEALDLADNSQFGLAAGLWTTDLDRAWRVGRALQAGTVWINTYHHFYPEAEVGGFKKSGLGRQQGLEGLATFSETKHLNFDSKRTLW